MVRTILSPMLRFQVKFITLTTTNPCTLLHIIYSYNTPQGDSRRKVLHYFFAILSFLVQFINSPPLPREDGWGRLQTGAECEARAAIG